MATLFTDAMLVCPALNRAEPGWLLVKDGRIAASAFETAEAPTDEVNEDDKDKVEAK